MLLDLKLVSNKYKGKTIIIHVDVNNNVFSLLLVCPNETQVEL